MEGGIKIKTMNTYKKDIERFKSYLTDLGDRAEVRNYLLDPREGERDGNLAQAMTLVRYAIELSEDETLSTSAFDSQFQAIKRMMVNNLRDTRVFDMDSVKEARRVARNIVSESRKMVVEAMRPNERTAYEAQYANKVPFTEEMMIAHRVDYFENTMATIEDKMAYVATALGYHIGNRPLEESSNGPRATNAKGDSDEDHRYMVGDIQYQLEDKSFISGVDINSTNKEGIQYISVMVNTHKGETLKAKSSKGFKKRPPNSVRNDNGAMELQLFEDLIEWPDIAKLRTGDFFFSRNTKEHNLKLTTHSMVSRMKETARKQGIDPNLISAKSLRKAFGTDMTRSNVPTQVINVMGRWSETSKVCINSYAIATPGKATGTMSEGILRTSNNDILRFGRSRDQIEREEAERR